MTKEQLINLKRMLDNQRQMFEKKIERLSKVAPYLGESPELKNAKEEWDKTVKRLCKVQKELDAIHPKPPPKQTGKVIFITAEEREFDKFDRLMRSNGNDFTGKGL